MIDHAVAFIVAENKWFTVSIGAALVAGLTLLLRLRRSEAPVRQRVMAIMNLLLGVTIGTMAFGHLLAITTKLAIGTLEGPTFVLYGIGIVLAVPSWWMIWHIWRSHVAVPDPTTLKLNIAVVVVLLALGLQNLPLAAPAVLNIAYQRHHKPVVGWAIVSMAVVVYLGLFVGSLIFWASGQSFEEFRGMQ